MKNKILKALPTIFIVSPHNNYGQFIPKGTVEERAIKRWGNLGQRLNGAINKTANTQANYGQDKEKTAASNSLV